MQRNGFTRNKAVILTALPIEYLSVRAHLSHLHEETYKGTVYEQGRFSSGAWHWDVAIAQVGSGNAITALEAERAIDYFNPRIVLFVGVAGGLKDVQLGDVVVATRVYGYGSGKAGQSVFLPRPDVGESSHSLIHRARAEARKSDWLRRIHGPRLTKSHASEVFVGPIAAGEAVVSSRRSAIYTFLQSAYNDALAIEMEGRGLLHATHGNEHVQALIVRGISDLLENKSDVDAQGFQEIAARHASAFAFEVLAKLGAKNTNQQAEDSRLIITQKEGVGVEHIYIDEEGPLPTLDITLHNYSSQTILPIQITMDVIDAGVFYYCDDEDLDFARSAVIVTSSYTAELSPDLKGQSKEVKVAHRLAADETDRFLLTIDQAPLNPSVAFVWYYVKLRILSSERTGQNKSKPQFMLFSIPPVDISPDFWASTHHSNCTEKNRATLQRMQVFAQSSDDSIIAYSIKAALSDIDRTYP